MIKTSKQDNGYLRVPVGERHHDIQSCQPKHNMEERPGVSDAFVFVVPHFRLSSSLPAVTSRLCNKQLSVRAFDRMKLKKEFCLYFLSIIECHWQIQERPGLFNL
jgi:hypothetical protein